MLEVLIAFLVLSVGLLGLAGMQTTGMRFNHSAFMHSQATVLAQDIIDRMRANRTGATGGTYNVAMNGSPSSPGKNCESQECATPAELAAFDIDQWITALNALPSGDGSVNCDGAGQTSVVVQWSDKNDPDQTLQSITVTTQL